MKGKIQAVSDKRLPKAISFKINGQWYSAWLQDQGGEPTDLEWLGGVVKDTILDFEFTESGDFKNITSAVHPEISVDKKGEAHKIAQPVDDAKNRSIEAQVCLKAAAEMTHAALYSAQLKPEAAGVFFQTKCEEAWEWIRSKDGK